MVGKGRENMVKSTNEKHALVVFGRLPEPGKVKTRLAKEIGDEKALEIYEQLLKYTLRVAQDCPMPAFFFYEGFLENGDAYPGFVLVKQSEGNLGERMNHTFRYMLENLGFERVNIIGTDCPDVNEETLTRALRAEADVIFGPARDGGFWLISSNRPIEALTEGVEWSTDRTLTQVMENAQKANIQAETAADTLSDIDTFEDWEAFQRANAQHPIFNTKH
jgi:uncharacterized protein